MVVPANGTPPAALEADPAHMIERGPGCVPSPVSSLIGRQCEIEAVCSLIDAGESRLVTILGAGGIGKSRLALAVLRKCVAEGGWDGAFVELRDVAGDAQAMPAIVASLGGQASADASPSGFRQIVGILANRRYLLVLDNLEHLRSIAADIARLLHACPRLVVLATSRGITGVAGERCVELGPLAVPDAASHLDEIVDSPAVRLFLDRARAVCPDLPTNPDALASIAEISRRLDGLPLALELAAAWTVVMSPAAILRDLRSLLLGDGHRPRDRSRSMRATIAWSYELLDVDERRLLRALSIFARRFDRADVEHIAIRAGLSSDLAAVSAGMRALVEKSLLVRSFDHRGEVTFAMFEVIREFAREQLRASNDATAVRDAHAGWAITIVERADAHPEQRISTTANLGLALDWLYEAGDSERHVHLCLLAVDHWYLTGYQREGHEHLRRAAAWTRADVGARARLFEELGRFARAVGDIAGAADALATACDESRRLGDLVREARCLQALGSIRVVERRHDDAVRLCEAALAIHRAADDRMGMAQCLHSIAWVAIERDQLEEADRLIRTSLGLLDDIDDPRMAGRFQLSLGALSVRQKRYPEAAEHFLICADLWRECGYQSGLAEVLADLGAIAIAAGECATAASYLLSSVTMYRSLGVLQRSPELIEAAAGLALACGNREQARQWLAAATDFRTTIGGQAWSTWAGHLKVWRASARLSELPLVGRPPSMAEAIDEIWRWLATLPPIAPHDDPMPRLTRRELEVLGLIAAGLSDQAIADQIFISRRTVSRHVSSILAKLKLESRTAAAVRAVREGLIPG